MLKYGRSQAAHIKRANCLFSGPAGIEVSVGSENAPADIFINSVKRAQFDWESDNNGDDTADIEIRAGTNLLWNTQYKRVVDSGIFEPHSGLREPDNCGCGVCEDGDCDMDDGDQLSSIAFRLALGPVGYNTHGGYLWFKCETLPTVTPALFNLNVAPSDYITVYSNGIGGVLSQISNTSYKGRTIQIQSISGGVQLDIYRQNDPDYHKGWQITAPSASVIRFEQYDAANNIIRDVTYTCAVDGDDRTSSRYDALAHCTTSRKSTLIDARKVVEEEVVTQLSRTLSGVQATYITVGRGTAAVERVSSRSELNGRYDSWETTGYSYWTDSFNHRRNGKLKLRQSPGGQWEYNIWDQSGRNKLRVTPIDGSVVTTDFAADSELEFNPDGNYPQLKARVTATSYTPLAGDDSNYRDALQPRTISEYVVKNAAPILTSRSWNIYNRIIVNSLPAISNTVIRAASQASAISEPANRISISVSTLDDPAIELILQGRPLYQQNPDGSCTTWEYALNAAELTITSYSGTTTAPMGLLDRSTYDVEVIDTLTGHTLSRETYLFTDAVEAPILAAEYHDYNAANGRLLATYYSDGTFIAHTWDCCRIISTIARDGQVTSQIAPPFIDAGESKTLYLSQGSLPGADGCFPANHTVTDPLGREKYSIHYVASGETGNAVSGYHAQTNTTVYPFGTSHHRVTTDPLGVVTTNFVLYFSSSVYEVTQSRGIQTVTIRNPGGTTQTYSQWTDTVSEKPMFTSEAHNQEWLSNGCRRDTATLITWDMSEKITTSESVYDFLGRVVATATPLGITSNFYDSTSGRLTKTTRTGSADTLYEYNSLGEQIVTCLDVNGNAVVDYAGLDRINKVDRSYELRSNDWWQVTYNMVWAGTNSATCITSSISRVRITGLGDDTYNGAILTAQSETEDWLENVTRTSTYTDASNATSWTVTDTPDSNIDAVQKTIAGYPVQTISTTSVTNTFTYDGFARQVTATDGRTNTTSTAYNDLGQVAYVEDAATNRTSFAYNNLGQRIAISNALGQVSHTAYNQRGQTIATWGTTYPVAYQFDAAGRMIAMATTRSNAYANVNLNTLLVSGDNLNDCNTPELDITQWRYDECTGLLTNKLYADGNGTSYTYTETGKIHTRTWARGKTTTYTYGDLGQLTNVNCLDSTPSITFTYDRLGRITSATSSASTSTFHYNGLTLDYETQNGYILKRKRDVLGREIGYELYNPVDPINPVKKIIYGYDAFNRLSAITSIIGNETNTFAYAYLPGTDLVNAMSSDSGVQWTRHYESGRNLITAVTNSVGSVPSVVSSFDYLNDPLGRRIRRADYYNSSKITNDFIYNQNSEVINATMNGDDYNYDFDPIGNREQSIVYSGQSTVTNLYTVNRLNQYASVTTAGSVVAPIHDLDGNLTFDGSQWHHTWDAENRLIKSEPHSATNGSVMFEYRYNYKNLRVEKTKKQLSGRSPSYPFDPSGAGTWNAVETRRYIWDGWNIAAEIMVDHVTPATNISYYTWGLDLSGTLQGAGGVGGLLSDTKVVNSMNNTYFVVGDANGNITEYVDNTGAVKAHYEYSAVGEITAQSGSMADDFTHRFSSKPFDKKTELVAYELRFYKPPLARWLSRDPIAERGGNNLYVINNNDVINKWDYLGFTDATGWKKKVLSSAEGHTYGCQEWKCHAEGFSGVANRASYVRHFEIKTLAKIMMNSKLKRTLAEELVTSIGVPATDEITIWAMNFRETALYFTDVIKRKDFTGKCKSGMRCQIDILMQVTIAEIQSMDVNNVETVVFSNNGDESKNKIAQTPVHVIDKGCAKE